MKTKNKKRILKKEFFITLFFKQNKWHKFGVLVHTLAVVFHIIKSKKYKMIPAGFLHDIGKPYVAFQDEKDKITNEYSFHNHEEISYQIIKNWKVSEYTKKLVRYHYLIRGMQKAKDRNNIERYNRMKRAFDSLNSNFIKDLKLFMHFDDLGKKSFFNK
jgi:CRISPR/Cas system-associated endonuclease Cas3-HD